MKPLRRRTLPVPALLLAAVLAAVFAGARPAPAQPPGGQPEALPRGGGTITGRVLYETTGAGAAGLDVVLYTLHTDGSPGVESTTTDEAGSFQFSAVSEEPGHVYLVGTRSGEVPFGTRVSFAAGKTEADVTLRVAEVTPDTDAATLGDSFLRIDRGCDRLRVNEAHQISNSSSQVIFVPEGERDGAQPIFEAVLPTRASGFVTPFGDSGLGVEVAGERVRYWGPVYPGSQELEFGYSLPAARGQNAFDRGFPAGASRVVFLTDAQGPEVTSPGLTPAEGTEIQGRAYRAMEALDIAAGTKLPFSIEVPDTAATSVTLERSELWLELDDAAVVVDESHLLKIDGEAPLLSSSDAPLFCLPLPEGAEALRFSPAALQLGLEADGSGGLAVRGPIPPGESVLAIRYRLPVAGDAFEFRRSFGAGVPLLSLFVADTGVIPETERLHRRRTARRSERSYLHLEGFEIGADEEVEVTLRRIPAPRSLSRVARVGAALIAAGAAAFFMAGPLFRDRRAVAAVEDDLSPLAAEREAIYKSIRDLDEDFETGKLTQEDYATLRAELKTRAVGTLQAERESREALEAAAASSAEERCAACDGALPALARFCPQCGQKTDRPEASG